MDTPDKPNLTVINGTRRDVSLLPARLSDGWTPDQPVTAEDARQVPGAIADLEDSLRPVTLETLAVLLEQTSKVWPLPEHWTDTADFYVEALEDVPEDLVRSALRHCRMTLKWFPKPSELRAPIVSELERRKHLLRRLRTMEQRIRMDGVEPPPLRVVLTDAEKAEAAAIARKTREILGACPLKRVPGSPADLVEHEPVSVEDAYALTGLDPKAWRRTQVGQASDTKKEGADEPG